MLEGALWRELKKFPPDTLARLLPHLHVAPNLRRLVEIWVEEKLDAVAASKLSRELVFGGGAALAALHLHHA